MASCSHEVDELFVPWFTGNTKAADEVAPYTRVVRFRKGTAGWYGGRLSRREVVGREITSGGDVPNVLDMFCTSS